MLSAQERQLVRQLWSGGPAALFDRGYGHDQAKAFLQREDVQNEVALLDNEFKQGPALEMRTRFSARRQLSQLAPGAAALIARAMAGPDYLRDQNGAIMRDARGFLMVREAETTAAQLRAAEMVMDALGVRPEKASEYRGDVQIQVLLDSAQSSITIGTDPSHTSAEEMSLSRERMRNTIEKLMCKLPQVRARTAEALALPPASKPKIVKRKVRRSTNGSVQKA